MQFMQFSVIFLKPCIPVADLLKKKKQKSKKHKKKSGISAKASDRVKTPQKLPDAHLQYEYVNTVNISHLTSLISIFIAGELEIIS